jgi:hypothetical protein
MKARKVGSITGESRWFSKLAIDFSIAIEFFNITLGKIE